MIVRGEYYDLIIKDTTVAMELFRLLEQCYPDGTFVTQFIQTGNKRNN